MVVACSDTERKEPAVFFQASSGLIASLSLFYHPYHKNPKSYIATSDKWSFLKETRALMANWGKLVSFNVHWCHCTDGGTFLWISVPFYWKSRGRVPSQGAERYFPSFCFFSIPLGCKVLNIGLLRLDIWILLTRTLKLLFAFKLNGF